MATNVLENLKINQEKRSAMLLISVFYFVFILYELFLRIGGIHKVVLLESQYLLFFHLQLALYGLITLILPFTIYYIRKNEPYKVKYIVFFFYILSYILFEVLVYSLINMEYSTATFVDIIFVMTSPIFVSKRYFWIVFSIVSTKISIIALGTAYPIVALGVIIMLFVGIVSYIILIQFSNYLKETNKLYDAQLQLAWYKTFAYKDELTGVYNKRFINLTLEDLDVINEKDIGLVMLDIDNFKQINDRFNHYVGDKVLQSVVYLIQDALQFDDVIGRYGGDEFILILKNRTVEGMQTLLDNIQNKLGASSIEVLYKKEKINLNVTATFGFYYLSKDNPLKPIDGLKEADNLLIEKKKVQSVRHS